MSDLGVVPECCPVLSDKLAANPSAAQVLAAIGDFGEIGGDEEAHSKATASAKHAVQLIGSSDYCIKFVTVGIDQSMREASQKSSA